jgi:CysZ protein
MDLAVGLFYQFRGLAFAFRDNRLLFWGLVRFVLAGVIMILLSAWILARHGEIMTFLWAKPEDQWILFLWRLVSWLVSLFLVVLAVIFAYLLSQIFFSVLIMDYMSRLTERKVRGFVAEPEGVPLWRTVFYLIRQEIPRAILPLAASVLILLAGWIIAILGPLMVIISAAATAIFLTPARRLVSFRDRWGLLSRNLLFHLGFGLPFLIPGLNLLFLSFAPVGATLYYLEKRDLSGKTRSGEINTRGKRI